MKKLYTKLPYAIFIRLIMRSMVVRGGFGDMVVRCGGSDGGFCAMDGEPPEYKPANHHDDGEWGLRMGACAMDGSPQYMPEITTIGSA